MQDAQTAERSLAAVERLLIAAGPPKGKLSQDDLDVLKPFAKILADRHFTTARSLQLCSETDFIRYGIPDGPAKLLTFAFEGPSSSAGAAAGDSAGGQRFFEEGDLVRMLKRVDLQSDDAKVKGFLKGLLDQHKGYSLVPPGAAGSSAVLTACLNQDKVVQQLLSLYEDRMTTSKPGSTRGLQSKRSGPITSTNGQQVQLLQDFGQYLALAGYDDAVDELIRVLLQLQKDFTTMDSSFETAVQLLQLPGAPGIGKTTCASAAWDLVLPRMQHVQQHDPALWEEWQTAGDPEQLLQRLTVSWSGHHGPLVFIMDMSRKDYLELHSVEKAYCSTEQQLALRMLWAAVDTSPQNISCYGDFLIDLKEKSQPLFQSVTPEAVQRFVLQAAGVPPGLESTLVWVWDEVNAVKLQPGQETTFCQQHLSQAVRTRVSMQSQWRAEGGLGILPVLVACTTRGSSTSLALTASRKARVLDLQVPIPEELEEDLPIVFMHLLCRLDPPPAPVASHMQGINCSGTLSQLSAEDRQQLAALCPRHIRKVLEWAGGNLRSATHLLGAMSGQPEGRTQHLKLGNCEWWNPSKARPLPQVVNMLVNRMEQAGWDIWLSSEGTNHGVLVQLAAYSLCNVPLPRSFKFDTTWAGGTATVTLEQLEMDGVVLLVGDHLQDAERPENVEKRVILPPALLAAYLRRIQQPGSTSSAPTLQMVQGMIEASRVRERDDLTILLLRLQLFGDVLRKKAVQLVELLPSLADTALASVYVKVPETGFLPTDRRQDLPQGPLQTLVEAAVEADTQPWCWVLGGSSGPDSWIVLRRSDRAGQCTGGCIVLHLQSKLTERDVAFSWKKVQEEVERVQPTRPGYDATEVLAIVADHRPPRQRQSTGSGSGRSSSSGSGSSLSSPRSISGHNISETPWQQLIRGRAVYLEEQRIWVTVVFRHLQWQVRGGAALLYDLLRLDDDDVVMKQLPNSDNLYGHPMLLARKSGKRGRPKLVPRSTALEMWPQWEQEHLKER